ncbi:MULTISPECIES: MocR-like pyridoxine biosynthesis transcription factor PdxR [Paenibacillus]|uniref:MocR-like pyridoxine biosynthesis transcription factor PdxR n=1 Tax=Paenibacillus TaxID=44249 RepID=UPI0022B8A0E5|nr:PLP-dependent aminotransferase family protein [Paenibacillus caseinilyticus]MCZ8519192.1 PLP-dependent aminotransferase family protein [Paenibacillus caseinilyticus]
MHFHISYHSNLDRYPTKLLALYHALRDGIVGGVLGFGMRLPSTRELAGEYGLSRGTVNQVYDMLSAEGYVDCRAGSGTYVAFRRTLRAGAAAVPAAGPLGEMAYPLSPWSRRLGAPPKEPIHGGEAPSSPAAAGCIDFHYFAPDLTGFPREEWNRCLHAAVREEPAARLRDEPAQGWAPLREAIAQYLRRARGMAAEPGQIAITGGSGQAIALLAQLLIGPGEAAVAETPAYGGFRRAIRAAGGRCIDAPVDSEGIVPALWDARVLFVTPTRQFPTGAVLSLERRQRLLEWADAQGAVIIEDDYDSEFRHGGKSLEPLRVLGGEGRVVYVGSFTKSLLPPTRIGYAVLPQPLVGPFVSAQALYEPYPVNLLEQKALAAFMAGGAYERHLRRMKRTYGRKFNLLAEAAKGQLGSLLEWTESDAGLHLFGWWRGEEEAYLAYRSACAGEGVRWSEAVTEHGGVRRYGLYLNFPHLTEAEIREGVRRMALAGERLLQRS